MLSNSAKDLSTGGQGCSPIFARPHISPDHQLLHLLDEGSQPGNPPIEAWKITRHPRKKHPISEIECPRRYPSGLSLRYAAGHACLAPATEAAGILGFLEE